MKRLALMAVLCLLAGISRGSFEIDDPAKGYEKVDKPEKVIVATPSENIDVGVIVPVGTDLYAPIIEQGECKGWRFDDSEPFLDDDNNAHFTTQTTYIGILIKTIDCINEVDGETLRFALVKTDLARLIWVELDRVLAAE